MPPRLFIRARETANFGATQVPVVRVRALEAQLEDATGASLHDRHLLNLLTGSRGLPVPGGAYVYARVDGDDVSYFMRAEGEPETDTPERDAHRITYGTLIDSLRALGESQRAEAASMEAARAKNLRKATEAAQALVDRFGLPVPASALAQGQGIVTPDGVRYHVYASDGEVVYLRKKYDANGQGLSDYVTEEDLEEYARGASAAWAQVEAARTVNIASRPVSGRGVGVAD